MKAKAYRKFNTGKLLAIHEINGTFVDCYGKVRKRLWNAEFDDCIVPISPDNGKALARSIGDEVTVASPSAMREMMLTARNPGLPYVDEASGRILAIEDSNVPVIMFEDCRVAVPWNIGSSLKVGDKVHIMPVMWNDDMQRMHDAMLGMQMAAEAVGRMHMADGYGLVLNWFTSVRLYHIVVEQL